MRKRIIVEINFYGREMMCLIRGKTQVGRSLVRHRYMASYTLKRIYLSRAKLSTSYKAATRSATLYFANQRNNSAQRKGN